MAVSTRACLFALASAAAFAGGCINDAWSPGGAYDSTDRGALESSSMEPKTWILIDNRTGQTIKTVEIPVGTKLIYEFYKGRGDNNAVTPDQLAWEIVPIDRMHGEPRFTMSVPDARNRKTEWFYRPAPELPPEMKPTDIPMPPADLPPAMPADMQKPDAKKPAK